MRCCMLQFWAGATLMSGVTGCASGHGVAGNDEAARDYFLERLHTPQIPADLHDPAILEDLFRLGLLQAEHEVALIDGVFERFPGVGADVRRHMEEVQRTSQTIREIVRQQLAEDRLLQSEEERELHRESFERRRQALDALSAGGKRCAACNG